MVSSSRTNGTPPCRAVLASLWLVRNVLCLAGVRPDKWSAPDGHRTLSLVTFTANVYMVVPVESTTVEVAVPSRPEPPVTTVLTIRALPSVSER